MVKARHDDCFTLPQVIAAAFLEISLAEVARLLCFESAEETTQFVKAYGLLIDAKERVSLRQRFEIYIPVCEMSRRGSTSIVLFSNA